MSEPARPAEVLILKMLIRIQTDLHYMEHSRPICYTNSETHRLIVAAEGLINEAESEARDETL